MYTLQLQHPCFWLMANGECLLLNPKPDNWEEWVVRPMTLCCSNQRPDICTYICIIWGDFSWFTSSDRLLKHALLI
jgi:hypothetical protein